MVDGPSIVFTRQAVVYETFIRKSSNLCKQILGIDASQLYPYSMCQPMPTGLYMRWKYDSETKRFTARQNKSGFFENMFLSYFQQSRPDSKIESNVTTGRQNKIQCFSVDRNWHDCNTVFEAVGCYYHYCPCQEACPSLTDIEIMRRIKRENRSKCAKNISNRKDPKSLKCGSAIVGNSTELMQQSKVIFEQISPINVLSAKKNSCTELTIGDSLVTFNVKFKCLNTCATSSPTIQQFSNILL